MAIDTRNKRASAVNVTLPFRCAFPNPDATIDASDRLVSAFLYSGIAAQVPASTNSLEISGVFVLQALTASSINCTVALSATSIVRTPALTLTAVQVVEEE